MNHVMIDLETLGTTNNSVILSIGAVRFNPLTGERHEHSFYEKIDLQSCLDLGLEVNASTIEWWMRQNNEARLKISNDPGVNIYTVLNKLMGFLRRNDFVWGNSARFDLGILQNAYNKAKIDIPWTYKQEMDLRTLSVLCPEAKLSLESWVGVAHDPISDCNNQITYLSKIFQIKGFK